MAERTLNQSKTIIVGIAEMQVSSDPEVRLVTYSLGSCLGIAIYDPVAQVGGLLHAMLPECGTGERTQRKSMFVDSGVPMLFRWAYQLGAAKQRLIVKVAGGSELLDEERYFGIGPRNYESLTQLLRRNGVRLTGAAVGGVATRTMRLDLATGRVQISVPGEREFEL